MDNRPQILITGWMPKEGRDILEKYCDLDFCNSEKPLSKTELIQRAKNKDGVVIFMTDTIDKEVIQACNNLKVNEKFGTDLNADEIEIATVAHTKGRDIIRPYIAPFIIATIIILIYMMIKYYKLNSGKVLLKTIGIIILAQVLLFSIMAITRIPIGRLTIPLVLTVYMLTLVWYTTKLENQLKTKKQEN